VLYPESSKIRSILSCRSKNSEWLAEPSESSCTDGGCLAGGLQPPSVLVEIITPPLFSHLPTLLVFSISKPHQHPGARDAGLWICFQRAMWRRERSRSEAEPGGPQPQRCVITLVSQMNQRLREDKLYSQTARTGFKGSHSTL
jgi:hypothetical protein